MKRNASLLLLAGLAAAAAFATWLEGQGEPAGKVAAGTDASAASHVLAASWQPGFCETRPSKPECRSQSEARHDATRFSLHGLWPQPRSRAYCGVSGRVESIDKRGDWMDLAPVDLPRDLRAELDRVMPGTRSGLDRHEWVKHGTCHGTDEVTYYADSLRLMAELNASPVRELFASRIGRELTSAEIRAAFDQAFGLGAGQRVRVSCVTDPSNGRRLIGEITIGLAGVREGASLGEAISRAATTDPGCPGGLVDRAGFQ